MKKLILLLFAIIVLAQWAAPLSMIWKSERVLSKGKVFRFKTEPVDPEDPLRGRYVSLNFIADEYVAKTTYIYNEDVYALIGTDAKGYAYITNLYKLEPDDIKDYVKVRVLYTNDENKVMLSFPFEEYYMDEYKAPEAESLYRKSATDTTSDTYALVNIYKGRGVTRDLIINGRSIHSYFK